MKEYLYKAFARNINVSIEEIYNHYGIDDTKDEVTLRAIIRDELHLNLSDVCPSHYKTRRAITIICIYLDC